MAGIAFPSTLSAFSSLVQVESNTERGGPTTAVASSSLSLSLSQGTAVFLSYSHTRRGVGRVVGKPTLSSLATRFLLSEPIAVQYPPASCVAPSLERDRREPTARCDPIRKYGTYHGTWENRPDLGVAARDRPPLIGNRGRIQGKGGTTTECRSFEARIEVDLREFDDAKRRKRLGRGSKAPTCDRTGGLEFQSRGDGGEASFESAPSHGAVAARPPLLSRAPN